MRDQRKDPRQGDIIRGSSHNPELYVVIFRDKDQVISSSVELRTGRCHRNEVVPGADWVLAGEGVATRKYDGACCMVQGGVLYRRYDAKRGKIPEGFIPAQDPDPVTGQWPGWLKVGDGPEDKWFRGALAGTGFAPPDGTYEAVGPHFQGNPEGMAEDRLIRHGIAGYLVFPRDFAGMKEALAKLDVEGVVFHHEDGRMAKVKKKDFGLPRTPATTPPAEAAKGRGEEASHE